VLRILGGEWKKRKKKAGARGQTREWMERYRYQQEGMGEFNEKIRSSEIGDVNSCRNLWGAVEWTVHGHQP